MGNKHKKFAGYGMHEFYMPTTKKGYTSRRDRKECEHYNAKSKWCFKLFNYCVGPTLCGKYQEKTVSAADTP